MLEYCNRRSPIRAFFLFPTFETRLQEYLVGGNVSVMSHSLLQLVLRHAEGLSGGQLVTHVGQPNEYDVTKGRLGEVRNSHPDGVVTGSPNPLVVGGVVQIWWDFAHGVPVLVGDYLTG